VKKATFMEARTPAILADRNSSAPTRWRAQLHADLPADEALTRDWSCCYARGAASGRHDGARGNPGCSRLWCRFGQDAQEKPR
jgi:hypothetical protein